MLDKKSLQLFGLLFLSKDTKLSGYLVVVDAFGTNPHKSSGALGLEGAQTLLKSMILQLDFQRTAVFGSPKCTG